VSQSEPFTRRAVPTLVLVSISVLAVIILGYYGWRAIAGYNSVGGPRKKISPGQYDLRVEMMKRSSARASGDGRNGN